jgi:predicted DCC family thiol-disulfide oxidoreductase YuxK
MYELHVIDQAGRVFRGVEAFGAIWQAFPDSTVYTSMSRIINMPLVSTFAHVLYKVFARIRPYLPKRHGCDNGGACRVGRKK